MFAYSYIVTKHSACRFFCLNGCRVLVTKSYCKLYILHHMWRLFCSILFIFFFPRIWFRELQTKTGMYKQWLLLHPHPLWLGGKGKSSLVKNNKDRGEFLFANNCVVPFWLCCVVSQTRLMYKWTEPKICSETAEGAVKLPASGEKQTCPPCNPGFFVTNSSTCEPCSNDSYSNGTGEESAITF